MARMPWRTRLLTTLLDRGLRGSITDMDIEQIQRSRSLTYPNRPPFTWVVGRTPRHIRISDTWFETRDGSSRQVRVYRPLGAGRHPVVVYFHGGGWVLGSPRQYDSLCARLADQVEALVLSVDYRMAPEHRAPLAVLDAIDAVRWVASGAEGLGGDPTRLAVCGDSAGGNLAAAVCHAAYDDGGPAIAHQALIYPGLDLTMSFPSIRQHAHAPVLTAADIEAFLQHYLGPEPALQRDDPLISPFWREQLRGLPPALVQTADLDPLRDEGQAYAARLREAGVPVRATNYLGMVHGFASFPGATLAGAQAMLELTTELRRHLAPPPGGHAGPPHAGKV